MGLEIPRASRLCVLAAATPSLHWRVLVNARDETRDGLLDITYHRHSHASLSLDTPARFLMHCGLQSPGLSLQELAPLAAIAGRGVAIPNTQWHSAAAHWPPPSPDSLPSPLSAPLTPHSSLLAPRSSLLIPRAFRIVVIVVIVGGDVNV